MSVFIDQTSHITGLIPSTLATNKLEDAPLENRFPALQTVNTTVPTNTLTDDKPAAIVSAAAVSAPSRGSKSKKKKAAAIAGQGSSSQCGSQGENTGRWTAEEHRLFLQGLELHGKGWKKIASLIKSRTVVQIRTHAQKYFQKLAKARQNGEEGDVTMEGRGCAASIASSASNPLAQSNKRWRQVTGTKRKAIQTVVASAIRQGRKLAAVQAANGVSNPLAPIPAISPILAPFFTPNPSETISSSEHVHVTYCAPQLENALFRFLTPMPPSQRAERQINDVARQAGANPIILPAEKPANIYSADIGEISPTGVDDLSLFPSWNDANTIPSWYGKGADVDELLDAADTLDWLLDTGDVNETYQPHLNYHETLIQVEVDNKHQVMNASTSVTTLPHVDSNVDSIVPSLPDLFGGTHESTNSFHHLTKSAISSSMLHASQSVNSMRDHLQVLMDSPMEEHDFVATILESSNMDVDDLSGYV